MKEVWKCQLPKIVCVAGHIKRYFYNCFTNNRKTYLATSGSLIDNDDASSNRLRIVIQSGPSFLEVKSVTTRNLLRYV